MKRNNLADGKADVDDDDDDDDDVDADGDALCSSIRAVCLRSR